MSLSKPTNPPPGVVLLNEQGNFDPQQIWEIDMDGIVMMKLPPDMISQKNEITRNLYEMITFARLLTNLCNIMRVGYKPMSAEEEANMKDLDLVDTKAFVAAISRLGTFAKMYQRNHKINNNSHGVSLSEKLVSSIVSVVQAPATFMGIAQKMVSGIGIPTWGSQSNVETLEVGKFIIIIEGIAGAWLMKLKYSSFKYSDVEKMTSNSCYSSYDVTMNVDYTEMIYVLDDGSQLTNVEGIISRVRDSNVRIKSILEGIKLGNPLDTSKPLNVQPAPRPSGDESKDNMN